MSELTALVIAILSSSAFTGLITFLLTRRKFAAEIEKLISEKEVNRATEADVFAEAIQKLTANNSNLQDRNTDLYKSNVALEKALSDQDTAYRSLAARLADRDSQIRTLDDQLRLLQDKERHNEITSALVSQQQAIIGIAESYQKIIADRERTIKELVARTGPLKGN